jgi:hypothetical protein
MKNNIVTKLDIIRSARCKKTAEVFTPPSLVNIMLDKLPSECWKEGKTFIDRSCGNGNILVEVLRRKVQHGSTTLQTLSTIHGSDIMKDNVRECRARLLKIAADYAPLTTLHITEVIKRITWVPLNKFPSGSLSYDFDFDRNEPNPKDITAWYNAYKCGNLDDANLPVRAERIEHLQLTKKDIKKQKRAARETKRKLK